MKNFFKNKIADYVVIAVLIIAGTLYNDIPAIKHKLDTIETKLDSKVNKEEFNQFRTEYYIDKRDVTDKINSKVDKQDFEILFNLAKQNAMNYNKNLREWEKDYKIQKQNNLEANK